MELRCEGNKVHGVVLDGILVVRCHSRFCGWRKGVVVEHRFNLHTHAHTTVRYTDPQRGEKRN